MASSNDDNRCVFAVIVNTCVVIQMVGGKQSRMCEMDGLTLRFLPVNVTPPLNLSRPGNCDPLWWRLYITVSRRITPCHLDIVYLVQPLAFRGAGNAMLA
jgi:hypothetical protein